MTKEIKNLGNELLFEAPEVLALLFAGPALYMSELDPIVREQQDNTKNQLKHWAKMYNLGFKTMPFFAILGTGAAIASYVKTKENAWLYGAAALFAVVPFTFIALMPTNKYLEGVLK